MTRRCVVSSRGGSIHRPPTAATSVHSSLPAATQHDTLLHRAPAEDPQQPLVFVTFNVTSLAGDSPHTDWRTQLLLESSLAHAPARTPTRA
eukprot:512223-Prorocentrum_lima.AAC.1